MSQNLPLINKANYIAFTSSWQQLPPDTNLNLYFQIKVNDTSQPIYGVQFPVAAIRALLSTVGITKVKARFGIENGHFNVILFGTDEQSVIHSAYYIGSPSTTPPRERGRDGNISRWLARNWIGNWANAVATSGNTLTPTETFKTGYGILQGYTYEMKEFMDAMYKGANASIDSAQLLLHFALPRYYQMDAVNPDNSTATFNLVLQRIETENGQTDSDDKDDDNDDDEGTPYYDISAPCPPICGTGTP